jgi:hypothetical protein
MNPGMPSRLGASLSKNTRMLSGLTFALLGLMLDGLSSLTLWLQCFWKLRIQCFPGLLSAHLVLTSFSMQ